MAAHDEPGRPHRLAGTTRCAGADVFLGLSAGAVGEDAVARMAPDAIIFALANPTPEVDPVVAHRYAAVVATGRSDYPNQINNVLAFPGVFAGAFDAGARAITETMKLAAAAALGDVVRDDLRPEHIVPTPVRPAGRAGGRGRGGRAGALDGVATVVAGGRTTGRRRRARNADRSLVVEVDQTEAVALGVGDDDEVRILGPLVPVDPAAAESAHPIHRRLLTVDAAHAQIEVHARRCLYRCAAQLQRQRRSVPGHRIERAPPVGAVCLAYLVAEQIRTRSARRDPGRRRRARGTEG